MFDMENGKVDKVQKHVLKLEAHSLGNTGTKRTPAINFVIIIILYIQKYNINKYKKNI